MKEKLIELLGLKPEATETEIVKGVESLKETIRGQEKANSELQKEIDQLLESEGDASNQQMEKRIAKIIAQSGGALNRDQAILAIKGQDENAAAKKAKKK